MHRDRLPSAFPLEEEAGRRRPDVISIVEAAYDLDSPERAWLHFLAERASLLVPGATRGVAYTLDASTPGTPRYGRPVESRFDAGFERALYQAITQTGHGLMRRVNSCKVSSLTELLGTEAIGGTPFGDFILASGAPDTFGCVALDAEGRGVVVSTDLPFAQGLGRALRYRWRLVGAHIATAHRLRVRQACGVLDECVLDAGGRVVHAEGDATSRRARDGLRKAVVARDRARTRAVRTDTEQALALWPGLVAGRWSLVDRFESDGRRYVVARRNDPRPAGPLTLSQRERQVLAHVVQGDSVKVTAYALGLSPSTVSEAGWTLRLKLGVRSIGDLAALATSDGP